MSQGTHHTCHRSTSRAAVAKALPPGLPVGDEFFVASVLTLPVADLAGDIVRPDGLTWDQHKRFPMVDFEHGRHPEVGSVAVGWARPTLGAPGGAYCVHKCKLPDGVETWVGGTYFDKNDTLSRQVCFGVRDGQWPGVSLEFLPDWSVAKSLGRSPLERRDAYEFRRAHVVRWTHCAEPVCPGAVSVLKSLPPEFDALARTLRDGRIRGESLHPLIQKSLARYRPTAKFVAVRPVEKATMPAPTDDPQTVYDPDMPEETPGAEGDAPALGGVSAKYKFAQGLTALIEQYKQDMQTSDDMGLRKASEKDIAKISAVAEEIKGRADKHDAKLNGGAPPDDTAEEGDEGEDEGSDDADESDDEADDDDTDMDKDDEGAFKAVRSCYRPILKAAARRYTLAEITKGVREAARPAPAEPTEPQPDAAAVAAAERLRKQLRGAKQDIKVYSPN
jgi:hypothetical protein